MSRKPPLEKNYFYIVYDVDFFSLPIAYCENLEELARYVGKTKLQTTNLMSRYRKDPRYKKAAMKAKNGHLYRIAKWHINGANVEPAYKGGEI